jgi:hypothetical protein
MFSKGAAYLAGSGNGAATVGGLSRQGKDAKGVSAKFVGKRS